MLVQDHGDDPFSGTYFDAAIDAHNRLSWHLASMPGSLDSRFQTQQRQMDRAALILAIDCASDQRQREQIAHILSIPGQILHDSAGLILNQHAYSVMGDGICSVLDAIPLNVSIFLRLAQAGAVAGIWPSPLQWDRHTNSYRSLKFPQPGTRASPG
ncbi:MAG: hypothetical protein DRH37_10755 [Deltaproteobacteria bacterium]|nr:MAG: hypothetical protein DRH37_10755 [Deltaproteobacteria bacterium]